MALTPILQVNDLVKVYPGVKAVDHVDLSIEQGRCFGLLGPNGAGKTTVIEIMEGIKRPTSGEVLYRGSAIGNRSGGHGGPGHRDGAVGR